MTRDEAALFRSWVRAKESADAWVRRMLAKHFPPDTTLRHAGHEWVVVTATPDGSLLLRRPGPKGLLYSYVRAADLLPDPEPVPAGPTEYTI